MEAVRDNTPSQPIRSTLYSSRSHHRMSRKHPPRLKPNTSHAQAVGFFMRQMQRFPDKRRAMGYARRAVAPSDYPEIVKRLLAIPQYRWAAAGDPFPEEPSGIPPKIKLQPVDPVREFAWSASILEAHSKALREFVLLRTKFETHFVTGELGFAEDLLNEIQARFGWSLWLVVSRIQLLALSKGLQAQKTFLEGFLENPISSTVGWIAYTFSLRAEENYSLARIQEVLSGLSSNASLFDYLTYHLNPYEISSVDESANIIAWEEMHPIVDRLHAHVAGSRLELSRDPSATHVVEALQSLHLIGDPLVAALLKGVELHQARAENYLQSFDAVICVKAPIPPPADHLKPELIAVAELLGCSPVLANDSILSQATGLMKELLVPGEAYLRSRQQLQKLSLTCGSPMLTAEIAAFIERIDRERLIDVVRSGTQRYRDACPTLGVSSLPHWFGTEFDAELLSRQRVTSPDSPALSLLASLKSVENGVPDEIPSDLSVFYRAILRLYRDQTLDAIDDFASARNSQTTYLRALASRGLFVSFVAAGDLQAAAEVVIDQALAEPESIRLYPLDEIAAKIRLRKLAFDDPYAASIVVHLASRRNSAFERDLSDQFENALARLGVERPSELFDKDANPRLIYFLCFVCTIRQLEDSTVFPSVEAAENERILLCQFLTSADAQNATAYSNEIRSITRDQNIAVLLRHVEGNMIYVDREGLLTVLADNLNESFERYKNLLASPELEYQSKQISRIMKELLAKSPNSDTREMVFDPADESSLLEHMRTQFIDAFALNSAYGLNTNLSTSIRHGVIECHIRAPFVAQDLMSTRDATGSWIADDKWRGRFAASFPDALPDVQKHLGRFAEKVGEEVRLYRDELLHILRADSRRKGLFSFNATAEEVSQLATSISPTTSFEEFVERLFDHSWSLVDKSMVVIRSSIRENLQRRLGAAADSLLLALSKTLGARETGLLDAIARSKTEMQAKMEDIANWFRRPVDVRETPFELEQSMLVAIQQIENCYTGSPVSLELVSHETVFVDGGYLDAFVELSFLVIQNAVKHGGFHCKGYATPIRISATSHDGTLELMFENSLEDSVDLEAVRRRAEDATERYSGEKSLFLATSDDGSGLPKLNRIMRFDLSQSSPFKIDVLESRSFRVTFFITRSDVEHADLHS